MAAPCKICSCPKMSKAVGEMVGVGTSDQAIADRLGNISRMAVSRHRRNHLLAPALAVARMAAKGTDIATEREKVIAAAEAGDPMAFVGLANIVSDLQRVHARLERQADAAEQAEQRMAVASLSAQQLRAAEVRAKMGGIGGYGVGRPGEGIGGSFSVTINLGGSVEAITAVTIPGVTERYTDEIEPIEI